MENQLRDKVAIITGASSGIGECTAILFSRRGASVALCGRNAEALESARARCQEESSNSSARFITIQGDLSERDVQKKVLDDTIDTFGRLDILVLNAGLITASDKLETLTLENFDNVVNLNIKSVFFLVQMAMPHLEHTQGNVIAVSSVVSTIPNPSLIAYSLTKAALDHFIRLLAANFGPKGVRFNTVRPSFVKTNVLRCFSPGDQGVTDINDMMAQKVAKDHPLGGRIGSVEENAKVIAFLASEEAAYVTGVDIQTDGASGLKTAYM